MNAQPVPPPSPERAEGPPSLSRAAKIPLGIRVGIILVIVGLAFIGVIFAWGYYNLRGLTSLQDLVRLFQGQYALAAVQSLLLEVGFFLIFDGILRILPRMRRWTRVGPFLILLGGVLLAAGDLAGFVYAPSMYGPADLSNIGQVLPTVAALAEIGSLVVETGMILSLIAVALGALARRIPPTPSAPA
ncbi:MAG TPA: hypothetical protein HA326_04550 [Thermoplasmata archaeon]|nr:hypothetical protein [Thermoplasmata archaeon]